MLKRAALRISAHNRELVQEAQGRFLSESPYPWVPDHQGKLVYQRSQETVFSKSSLAQGAKKNIVQYLGIAADEPERIARHQKPGFMLPLVEIGWDEAYCRQLCEENDLLSPIYTDSARGGCWFCHNQGVDRLRLLRKTYPDLWAMLLKWDLDSPTTFKPDGHTVHDYDLRYEMEDEGLVPADRKFRWKMLEGKNKIILTQRKMLRLLEREVRK